MVKKIIIQIGIDEVNERIGTVIDTEGFKSDSISTQFELLGIFENLKDIQKEKIKKLMQTKL